MSEKATLLQDADLAFTELHGAIEGLSDEQMRRVWLGSWGVREILIHISGWHDEMIPALARVGRHRNRDLALGARRVLVIHDLRLVGEARRA